MEKYQCCICKGFAPSEESSHFLDPCALVLVSNIDRPKQFHKEQDFYCHFECFRKLVNNDDLMYILEED